jgi:hypothetical protein
MESILDHGHSLDSLYSHDMNLGERPPPSFLYYILQLVVEITLKW